MAICELCQESGGVGVSEVPGRDLAEITCPRCGVYRFDVVSPPALEGRLAGSRYILAGVTRARTERGDRTTEISSRTADDLIASAPVPQTIPEYVDRLLLYLAKRVDRPWKELQFEKERDFPLLFMKSASDMNGFLNHALALDLLEATNGRLRFSPGGWERVELLRMSEPRSTQAFVAMWFDPSTLGAWTDGLKPGIEDSQYFRAIRSDREEYLTKVDDWIISQIRLSGLVVADFTGNRGGVYYEAGFAMALDIPVIFTCREDHMDQVHFDTNHFPHITWANPADLRRKLNDRIVGAVLPTVGRGAKA